MMRNKEAYMKSLELSNALRAPLIEKVFDSLRLQPGSTGLDAGCGTGYYTMTLAETVGSQGHVTGLDMEEAFLQKARTRAPARGMTQQVEFAQGDIRSLPFGENRFDWVFSMDVIGSSKSDPAALLTEMARTVKPGGMVYMLNWSSQKLLPGYPALEARLNATSRGTAPFEPAMKPELHLMCALGWLKKAGLGETSARTFVQDIHVPLDPKTRAAVADLFEMRWGRDNPELTAQDRADYQRLCRVDSPDFILNDPGYYGFFTYSLFCGRVQ